MASRLRGKTSPTPEENERPADSWRPLAQFREVIESEDLVGQTPQNILIPAPALLTVERLDLAAPGNMGPRTGVLAPVVLAPVVLAPVVLGHGSTSTFWPEPLRPSGWVATPASSAAEARVSTVGEFRATVPGDLRTRLEAGVLLTPVAFDAGAATGQSPERGYRPAGAPEVAAGESRAALRNATTLGSSLVFTTAIGFAVGLYYQAKLGPGPAGRVAAAEGLTATTLVILAFGLDNYARKEVALRPEHAREFVPGAITARFFATIPFLSVVMAVMLFVGRSRQVIVLLALFGVTRFLVQSNELLAACLHAVGSVRGLSRQNLVTKVAWGLAIVGFLQAGFGGYSIPMGWIVGESLKLAGLARRTGRELHMWSSMRNQHVLPVLRRSVPFLSSSVLTALAMVLDVTMMQFLTNDDELGYYRFAQSLLLLVLILATVLPWVLLPMASKAAGRSAEDFAGVMRKSLGSVMALAIPLCILLALNADTVITTVAPKFSPAIPALRILAVTAIGTYLTLVCATFLQASGKTWVGVRIGISIVALDAVLVLVFVPVGWHRWGAGGAGTTAALAILVAEVVGTTLYVRSLGRGAWDRASLRLIGTVVLATVPVLLADRFMAAKGFSFARAFADVVVYGLNLVLLHVVEPAKLRSIIRPTTARPASP